MCTPQNYSQDTVTIKVLFINHHYTLSGHAGKETVHSTHLSWFMLRVDFTFFFFLSAFALSCIEARNKLNMSVVCDVQSPDFQF